MVSRLKLIVAMVGAALLASPMAAGAAEHHFVRFVRPGVARVGTFHTVHTPMAARVAPFRSAVATPVRGFNSAPVNTWAPVAVSRPYYGANAWPLPVRTYNTGAYYNQPYGTGYGYGNGYGSGAGYAANPCMNAARLAAQARQDRAKGHPAAANDLFRYSRSAQAGCSGGYGGYGYNGYGSYGPSALSGFAPLFQNFIR